MRRFLIFTAAVALLGTAPIANAQKIDKNGKCHAADGKFAKMEVCKGGAVIAAHKYKLDAKGNCHDEKGKMSKKDLCKA